MGLRDLAVIYAIAFPHTWEKDLQIADLLEQDYDISEVAEAIPCSKEEVCETFERIKSFLFPGLSDEEIIAAYPPDEP